MSGNKSRVNTKNFIVIHGWMVDELNIKGNELLVYAIIYGFSQTENQFFTGSLQYLADWTKSTKQGVMKNLKSLLEKNLIQKEEYYVNQVKFVKYYTTKFNTPMQQSLIGYTTEFNRGMQLSLPNNINIENKESKNKINNSAPDETEIQKVVNLYHEICKSYPKLRAVSEARKKAIRARIRTYGIDIVREVFEKAESSEFLKGKNDRNWSADFDWMLKDANFVKIMEGNYDSHQEKLKRGAMNGNGSNIWNAGII